ncbi:MAG TPA: chloride channel protein [Puia sp.]|nr:chloride channel protein [Puia sp.]
MKLILRIRKRIKNVFDKIGNDKLKQNLLQAVPFWIASLLTGLVAVLYARLFFLAERGTSYVFGHFAWAFFIITPACFIIAWLLVKKFAPYSRGSGIPQVMASIELANPRNNDKVNKFLSLRVMIVKIISSLFMVFGGGVIGREGPTIQVAGSIFRKVNQWLPAWWPKISKRNMIMTGAAAGLAAAFNTPLGGIVFAVEELTKTHINYFKTAIFSAVIISGLTAQALLGPYLYLGYPTVNNLSPYIFLGVMCVAIITGLAGSGSGKIILWIIKWKSTFKKRSHVFLFVFLCGFIIAALAFYVNKIALGSGKELMANALFSSPKYLPWYSPLLRIGGSILSFTSGGAGGIFAPSLSAGASIGSVFAEWMHLSDANTNLLILAGMVGFLTGITRTPFTSAIIVLEMTDRHNLIFYLMFAGMISSIVAAIIDRHSFYDHLKVQYMHEVMHENV